MTRIPIQKDNNGKDPATEVTIEVTTCQKKVTGVCADCTGLPECQKVND